jgi:hypothetical protein
MPMTRRIRKRKCKNCHDLFSLDHRSAGRQKFCSKQQCQKASKADSQQRWLSKPENKNYFKGPDNVARVQQWRKQNPGYWHKAQDKESVLQDSLIGKSKQKQGVAGSLSKDALQDVMTAQPLVLIGLIAHLTGCALQDDIAISARRLRQLGDDVLNPKIQDKGGSYDIQAPNKPPANPKDSGPVQLARSPTRP